MSASAQKEVSDAPSPSFRTLGELRDTLEQLKNVAKDANVKDPFALYPCVSRLEFREISC